MDVYFSIPHIHLSLRPLCKLVGRWDNCLICEISVTAAASSTATTIYCHFWFMVDWFIILMLPSLGGIAAKECCLLFCYLTTHLVFV